MVRRLRERRGAPAVAVMKVEAIRAHASGSVSRIGMRNPNPRLLCCFRCFAMKGASSKADSKKADSRLAVKKPTKKEAKAAKDPNKPKRPPSAFFVFMCADSTFGRL
ncbi:hypothetical protein CASFOL_014807 [Castilleja foliolosa]|uniref:Uncharacterized protein n=1 Tax=Castilleja foliolosa TaxID=1961234 RepID=A0ABD3DDB6_9LAMI